MMLFQFFDVFFLNSCALLSWPFRPSCIPALYPGRRSMNIRPAAFLFFSLALGWYKLAFQAGNA